MKYIVTCICHRPTYDVFDSLIKNRHKLSFPFTGFLSFAGFIVVSAEAPCCCMFIDFVQHYSSFVESRPKYQKAALYVM